MTICACRCLPRITICLEHGITEAGGDTMHASPCSIMQTISHADTSNTGAELCSSTAAMERQTCHASAKQAALAVHATALSTTQRLQQAQTVESHGLAHSSAAHRHSTQTALCAATAHRQQLQAGWLQIPADLHATPAQQHTSHTQTALCSACA